MPDIESLVSNYLTDNGERSIDDIAEILANNEDIEIAMEIYYELECENCSIVELEREVAYMRKNRIYDVAE